MKNIKRPTEEKKVGVKQPLNIKKKSTHHSHRHSKGCMKSPIFNKCELCGKEYNAYRYNQKYCGSDRTRTGCSHKAHSLYRKDYNKNYHNTDAYKESVKLFREKNPGYTRASARLERKLLTNQS